MSLNLKTEFDSLYDYCKGLGLGEKYPSRWVFIKDVRNRIDYVGIATLTKAIWMLREMSRYSGKGLPTPTALKGLILRFYPSEKSPLSRIRPTDKDAPYVSYGKEDGYNVTECSFYYKDNFAIGVGWQLDPKSTMLGYHPHDVEFVRIYTKRGLLEKVFFSQHSSKEGRWLDAKNLEIQNGFLVVYVARNSHACYPNSGTHKRLRGLANDYTSTGGESKRFLFSEMTPSFNWSSPNAIKLYAGLRPKPSGSMTEKEIGSLRQNFWGFKF